MLDEDVTIFLGLAGAMVPAGLGEFIAYLLRERKVDCLVSTGANLFHDLCEGLGIVHYQAAPAQMTPILMNARLTESTTYSYRRSSCIKPTIIYQTS